MIERPPPARHALQASPTGPLHDLFTGSPECGGIPLNAAHAALRREALAAVDVLSDDELRTADLAHLRQRLVASYWFDPLVLHWDRPLATQAGAGSTIQVLVPFTGAAGLFDMRPADGDGERPRGWVRDQHLVLLLPVDPEAAERDLQRQRLLVTDWVSRVGRDVARCNKELARDIRRRIDAAAARVRSAAALALDIGPRPHRASRPRAPQRGPAAWAGSTALAGSVGPRPVEWWE